MKLIYLFVLLAQLLPPQSLTILGAGSLVSTSGYTHEYTITLGSSTYIPASQSNFTVLVCANLTLGNGNSCPTATNLKVTGSGGSVTSSSGYDITFSSTVCTAPTLMKWEMPSYTGSSGAMEAWVYFPSLVASGSFYMCVGDSAITTFQGGSTGSAWNSNYAGVYHLSSVSSPVDSITGAVGTNSGVTLVSGQIGEAGQFSNATTNLITTDITTDTTQKSIILWTYMTGSGGGGLGRLWSKNEINYMYNNPGGPNAVFIQTFSTTSGTFTENAMPSENAWHMVALTYDSSSTANVPVFYIDAVSQSVTVTTGPSGTVTSTASAYTLGNRPAANRDFGGTIDEFEVTSNILSANWITTEFNNQSAPATFMSFSLTF